MYAGSLMPIIAGAFHYSAGIVDLSYSTDIFMRSRNITPLVQNTCCFQLFPDALSTVASISIIDLTYSVHNGVRLRQDFTAF